MASALASIPIRVSEVPATRASLLARLQESPGGLSSDLDWRCFLDIYQPLLFAHARRRGLDGNQAEDVVQEILVGISQRLPEFDYQPEKCRFRTWLFRVAERKVADHWRRLYRQLPEAHPSGDDDVPNPNHGPRAIADTTTLEPDAAWDLQFEEELLQKARKLAGQRASPMSFRLYLHHVVKGHDVAATVSAFRESGVTPADVHQAKCRVLKLVGEELRTLHRKYGD